MGSESWQCTCYFPSVRNIKLAFHCLRDDYCEMSECKGRVHGTSVAEDCVSLKDSHIDFLFKRAKWSMKSRLRNQRRKGSKAETHWPENFKYDNRWLSFPISSRGPLADSSSGRLLAPVTTGITLFILFHEHTEFEKLKTGWGLFNHCVNHLNKYDK